MLAPHGATFAVAVRFYRECPGRSPTVNVSWFIAKAYLTNLYYNQSHYKAAIETCNEVVEVYKRSEGNQVFSEDTFPVLLSTQWTAVYDAELQALLGLCSLCAFVSNRTDARSVCLAVCPVQFVLYLKARCVIDQHCTADVWRSIDDFYTYNKQTQTCVRGFYMSAIIFLTLLHSIIASNLG